MMETIYDKFTCGALVVAKLDLIEVDANSAIQEAVTLMQENRVQSIPVYDTDQSDYSGVVSLFDVYMFSYNMRAKMSGRKLSNIERGNVRGKAFAQKVKKLIGYNNKQKEEEAEPLFAVKSTTSVKKVIKLMADGIPRILVSLGYVKSDTTKPLLRLLSPTDVIKFTLNEKAELPDLMGVPVEEMLETEAYALAPTTAPLVEVFHDLEESAMDAIGLTDASGALVAQLSVADVIRFADQIFDNDCGTVSFDERESVQQLFDRLGQRLHDPVCVRRGETFGDCIAKMIAASTHRVWMVDDKDGLVGVIRQQDVLNAIANYLGL